MWAIPTGTSSALKKTSKESQYMVSHPELDSDLPIGSDPESGCDIRCPRLRIVQGQLPKASYLLLKGTTRVLGSSHGEHLKEVTRVHGSSHGKHLRGGRPSTRFISWRTSQRGHSSMGFISRRSPEYMVYLMKNISGEAA